MPKLEVPCDLKTKHKPLETEVQAYMRTISLSLGCELLHHVRPLHQIFVPIAFFDKSVRGIVHHGVALT